MKSLKVCKRLGKGRAINGEEETSHGFVSILMIPDEFLTKSTETNCRLKSDAVIALMKRLKETNRTAKSCGMVTHILSLFRANADADDDKRQCQACPICGATSNDCIEDLIDTDRVGTTVIDQCYSS